MVFSPHFKLEDFAFLQDFINQLCPKPSPKLQGETEAKLVLALHLKSGEKSLEDNVELPYEFLTKAKSTKCAPSKFFTNVVMINW